MLDCEIAGQVVTQHMLQDKIKHFTLKVLFSKGKKNTWSNKPGFFDISQPLLRGRGGGTVSFLGFRSAKETVI